MARRRLARRRLGWLEGSWLEGSRMGLARCRMGLGCGIRAGICLGRRTRLGLGSGLGQPLLDRSWAQLRLGARALLA